MSRPIAAALLLLAFARGAPGQEQVSGEATGFPTPAERQGWYAPTTPEQATDYLASLRDAHAGMTLDTLALIPGDPVAPDSTLPVHLVTLRSTLETDAEPPGAPLPERVRVLVVAAQRGDDFAGFEVSLRMIRDLASEAVPGLLEQLEIAFVPAVNPWGLLWWVREEPSGVDPVLDHAALRSPALRALHDFHRVWRPHMVIELRDLDPTVYRIQAGLPTHPNTDPTLARFGRFYLLPYVANELAKASITFREQISIVPEPEHREPLVRGAESLDPEAYLAPGPLGAEQARNSFSLAGSLALMLGVASLDGPEGLGGRVELQYLALKALLEVTAGRADGLLERTTHAADAAAALAGGERETTASLLALRSRFETDASDTGLTWLVWSQHGTIMRQTTDRWRSTVRRLLVLPLPAAWVIEHDAPEWADLARAHGFVVERLTRSSRMEVGGYPVGLPDRLPGDLTRDLPIDEAPDASTLLVRSEREFAAGAWVVRASQPRARLLFTLLEPWSQDAPLAAGPANAGLAGADPPASESEDPLLYPVYRIDASELSGLRTEVLLDDGSARRGSD